MHCQKFCAHLFSIPFIYYVTQPAFFQINKQQVVLLYSIFCLCHHSEAEKYTEISLTANLYYSISFSNELLGCWWAGLRKWHHIKLYHVHSWVEVEGSRPKPVSWIHSQVHQWLLWSSHPVQGPQQFCGKACFHGKHPRCFHGLGLHPRTHGQHPFSLEVGRTCSICPLPRQLAAGLHYRLPAQNAMLYIEATKLWVQTARTELIWPLGTLWVDASNTLWYCQVYLNI